MHKPASDGLASCFTAATSRNSLQNRQAHTPGAPSSPDRGLSPRVPPAPAGSRARDPHLPREARSHHDGEESPGESPPQTVRASRARDTLGYEPQKGLSSRPGAPRELQLPACLKSHPEGPAARRLPALGFPPSAWDVCKGRTVERKSPVGGQV